MIDLKNHPHVFIHQRKELAELFGFETRNKYEILDGRSQVIGFVAEQGKGLLGALGRHVLGHWRSFELHLFSPQKEKRGRAVHPFRWFFQRLEFFDQNNQKVGALQQRFAFVSKRFDLEDSRGRVVLQVRSPFWRIWTFVFKTKIGKESARIEKKWSGLLKEAFMDADNFKVSFIDRELENDQRNLLVAATVFIDLQYFEKKASD